MEIVKSFFRKKKTLVYLIVFSIVILGLISLSSFINYYDNVVNDYYKTNSYISFISEQKYEEEFKKIKYISDYKIGIMMVPDYNCDTLKKSDSIIFNKDAFLITDILWDSFLLNDYYVPIFNSKDYNLSNKDNMVILMLPFESLNSYQKSHIQNIIGEKIIINSIDENKSYELIIKDVIDNPISTLLLSDIQYNEIQKDNKLYTYRVSTSDYKKQDDLRLSIMKLNYDKNFNVVKRSWDISDAQGVISIISFLKFGSLVTLVLLFLIFTTICNNILKDEKQNVFIERIVGYNKKQVINGLLLNIFLLISLSLIISLVLSTILFTLINNIFSLQIQLFNILHIGLIILFVYIIVLIELIRFYLKVNKVLKKDFLNI